MEKFTHNRQVVIYTRVSTDYQVKKGMSIESQEILCRKFAEMYGYTVKTVLTDSGKSGTTIKGRDGLEEALSMLDKNTYLLVYSLTRFSRSIENSVELIKKIESKQSRLMSFNEGLNGIEEDDHFLKWINILLGDKESRTTGKRVSHCMGIRRDKVGVANNRCHYGWRYDNKIKDTDGKLIPLRIKNEQDIIQRILELKDSMSASKIAKLFNNENVPTQIQQRNGSKCVWNHKTIISIINFNETVDPSWKNTPYAK